MKNLVTGASGLVGIHIALDLLTKGETVYATYTQNSNLENVKKVFDFYKSANLFEKINWIEMNLEDITQVFDGVKEMDCVYHSAAIVSFNKKDQSKIHSINIKGTANIVNACLEEKITKLGFISSVASIGRKANNNGLYSEKSKWSINKANSFYAISKYKAENEIWRGIQEGLEAVIVNPGIIIGPSSWNRSSTAIFKQIYKGLGFYPTGSNGFVDVRDVSKSIIDLVESPINAERYILVGENISYKNVFENIANELKVKPPNKKATKFLLELAWRIEKLRCIIARKSPGITKETARTSNQHNNYCNEKIKNSIDLEFNSIESAIKNTAEFLLKFN